MLEAKLSEKFSLRAEHREGGIGIRKRVIVGAVFVAILAMSGLHSMVGKAVAYELSEPVVYCEGVDMYGGYVTDSPPDTYVRAANNVQIDWSDNIIFHQFPAGAKVRTEVVLHDLDLDAAVYTLSAHFKIVQYDGDPRSGGVPVKTIYESSIAEGMWVDGRSDAYTAEVNELGLLLYGFNWDTRKLPSGWYRLVFWIQEDPKVNPLDGIPVNYLGVDITSHAPGDTDTTSGTMYGFVGDDFANNVSWLDMFLLPKTNGRK